MKKIVFGAALAALMVPSVASARTAAEALSVKSVAVSPVRATAVPGKLKAASTGTVVGILFGLAAVGAGIAAASASN